MTRESTARVLEGVCGPEVTALDAEPHLHLSPRAADAIAERMIELENACREYRKTLAIVEDQRDEAIKRGQALAMVVARTHETFGQAIGDLQAQINAVALPASLVPDLKRRVEFLEGQTPV